MKKIVLFGFVLLLFMSGVFSSLYVEPQVYIPFDNGFDPITKNGESIVLLSQTNAFFNQTDSYSGLSLYLDDGFIAFNMTLWDYISDSPKDMTLSFATKRNKNVRVGFMSYLSGSSWSGMNYIFEPDEDKHRFRTQGAPFTFSEGFGSIPTDWEHYTVVFSSIGSPSINVYKNGEIRGVATSGTFGVNGISSSNALNFVIGYAKDYLGVGNRYIGYIDEFRMYNVSLNASQVLFNYENPNFAPFNFIVSIEDEQSQSIENVTFTSDLYTYNSSSDGLIITDYTSPDELINFTVSYPSYYTQTFTNYNTSNSPLTVQMIPYENFSFSVKDSTTNSNIFNATVILNNVTYDNFSSFPFTTPLNDFGVYNYTVFADGYYNLTGEVNTTQFNYIFELEKIPIPLSSTCPLHVDSTERLFYMIFLLVGFVLTLLGFGMQKAVLTIFGSFFIMIVSFTLLACGSILVGILIVFSVCMLFIGATQHDV